MGCDENLRQLKSPDTGAYSSAADADLRDNSDGKNGIGDDQEIDAITGSGTSWAASEPKLEGYLQHSWSRAMALAHAAQQPISFFRQGSTKEPQPGADFTNRDTSDDKAAVSQSAYSPLPIKAGSLTQAWRQASHTGSDLLSSARAVAAAAPGEALHRVQVSAQQSVGTVQQGWAALAGYLSNVKAAVGGDSAQHQAQRIASGWTGASPAAEDAEPSRLPHWPWSSSPASEAADSQVHVLLSLACLQCTLSQDA